MVMLPILVCSRGVCAQNAKPDQYGYTGREADDSGLIYYRSRYYDPTLGRFTQRDTVGLFGGINDYGYALGNPLLYVDPGGRQPEGRGAQPLYFDARTPGPGQAALLQALPLPPPGLAIPPPGQPLPRQEGLEQSAYALNIIETARKLIAPPPSPLASNAWPDLVIAAAEAAICRMAAAAAFDDQVTALSELDPSSLVRRYQADLTGMMYTMVASDNGVFLYQLARQFPLLRNRIEKMNHSILPHDPEPGEILPAGSLLCGRC